MVRNVYRRLFPTRPVLGGVLSVASLSVLVATAYAATQGYGVEGSWTLDQVNHTSNVCNMLRSADYCQENSFLSKYCDPVVGGHHSGGTATYNPTTQSCDTGPNGSHISIDMQSTLTNHVGTITTTGETPGDGEGGPE